MIFVVIADRSAPSVTIQEQYQALLARTLAQTDEAVLSDEKRTELRLFRKKNGINSSAHMTALKRLGWTVDEYEVRTKRELYILLTCVCVSWFSSL